jgi:hypothetical protein
VTAVVFVNRRRVRMCLQLRFVTPILISLVGGLLAATPASAQAFDAQTKKRCARPSQV